MSLVQRDIRLALERGWAWLMGAVFYLAFAALIAIAVGGRLDELRQIAPGLAWAGVLFAVMLSTPTLFVDDVRSGAIDQLRLKGHSLMGIVCARLISLLLLTLLPVVLASFMLMPIFGLGWWASWRLVAGLVAAAPALAGYGVFCGAVMARQGAAGLLSVLLALPLLTPVLIFGVAAVTSPADSLWVSVEIRALVGLSAIGVIIGLAGAVAALRTNIES